MRNSPICVDASLIIRLMQSGTYESPTAILWKEWHEADRSIVAPSLLYYEVTNAIYKYVIHSEMLLEEAADILNAIVRLDITSYENANLYRRALELARRFSLSATYDAHYLALAEMLGAEFWTADRRLVKAVSAALPWVREVG